MDHSTLDRDIRLLMEARCWANELIYPVSEFFSLAAHRGFDDPETRRALVYAVGVEIFCAGDREDHLSFPGDVRHLIEPVAIPTRSIAFCGDGCPMAICRGMNLSMAPSTFPACDLFTVGFVLHLLDDESVMRETGDEGAPSAWQKALFAADWIDRERLESQLEANRQLEKSLGRTTRYDDYFDDDDNFSVPDWYEGDWIDTNKAIDALWQNLVEPPGRYYARCKALEEAVLMESQWAIAFARQLAMGQGLDNIRPSMPDPRQRDLPQEPDPAVAEKSPKHKDADGRLFNLYKKNEESMFWTVREQAKAIGVSPSTLVNCRTYKGAARMREIEKGRRREIEAAKRLGNRTK